MGAGADIRCVYCNCEPVTMTTYRPELAKEHAATCAWVATKGYPGPPEGPMTDKPSPEAVASAEQQERGQEWLRRYKRAPESWQIWEQAVWLQERAYVDGRTESAARIAALEQERDEARNEARVFEEQAIENWTMVKTRDASLEGAQALTQQLADALRCEIPRLCEHCRSGDPDVAEVESDRHVIQTKYGWKSVPCEAVAARAALALPGVPPPKEAKP